MRKVLEIKINLEAEKRRKGKILYFIQKVSLQKGEEGKAPRFTNIWRSCSPSTHVPNVSPGSGGGVTGGGGGGLARTGTRGRRGSAAVASAAPRATRQGSACAALLLQEGHRAGQSREPPSTAEPEEKVGSKVSALL